MATLLGVHAPVQGWTDEAKALAHALGDTGPYVWPGGIEHPLDALGQAALDPNAVHLLRLPTPQPQPEETPEAYADRVAGMIVEWRDAHVPNLYFIPGNEPDQVTPPGGDLPVAWEPAAWEQVVGDYAAVLKARFGGIRLASVPFTPGGSVHLSAQVVAPFDAVTCHVYWDGTDPTWEDLAMHDDGAGQSWTRAVAVAGGRPVVNTEANAIHTDAAILASGNPSRPEQIIAWLHTLTAEVQGVAFFIANGEAFWPDFPLIPAQGEEILAAIR